MTGANKLAEYVGQNVTIRALPPPLLHASLCVLDAVYAARQKYEERVDDGKGGGVIGRYVSYQGIARSRGASLKTGQEEDTLNDLINLTQSIGCERFADEVIGFRARALILLPKSKRDRGEKPPLRSEICLKLAQKLLEIDALNNTLLGLRKWADTVDPKDNAFKPNGQYAVKGIGFDTWHYLFMLAGNADLVKPDVHIRAFVKQVLGYEPPRPQIVQILREAAKILGITPKQLDSSIWDYQRKNK